MEEGLEHVFTSLAWLGVADVAVTWQLVGAVMVTTWLNGSAMWQ